MGVFEETAPSLDSYWRAVILFGRNVASYKFALGQSLLDLGRRDRSFISMENLAEPFAEHIVRHLTLAPKQATSPSSRFLNTCRKYSEGEVTQDQLHTETVRLGFNNVIDAFHVVNQGEIPTRFFVDRRTDQIPGIELTDDFVRLKESMQHASLPGEVEARWRLVETGWELRLPSRMLLDFNPTTEILFAPGALLRRRVKRTRGASSASCCFRCKIWTHLWWRWSAARASSE